MELEVTWQIKNWRTTHSKILKFTSCFSLSFMEED